MTTTFYIATNLLSGHTADSALGVLAIAHARLLRSRCVAERPTPAGGSNQRQREPVRPYPEPRAGSAANLEVRHDGRPSTQPTAPASRLQPAGTPVSNHAQPRCAAITRAKSVRYDKTILVGNRHTSAIRCGSEPSPEAGDRTDASLAS